MEPIRQDVSRQPFPKVTQMKHTCGRTWLSFACFLLFLAVSLAILLAWLSCARKPVAPAACTRDQLHQLALALMVYVTEGRRAPMPEWLSRRVTSPMVPTCIFASLFARRYGKPGLNGCGTTTGSRSSSTHGGGHWCWSVIRTTRTGCYMISGKARLRSVLRDSLVGRMSSRIPCKCGQWALMA